VSVSLIMYHTCASGTKSKAHAFWESLMQTPEAAAWNPSGANFHSS